MQPLTPIHEPPVLWRLPGCTQRNKPGTPQPFIDLIYIDPPFNSKRNYNVLFESIDSKDANAQKQAFADTWSNYSYMDELNEMAELHKDIYTVLKTFHDLKSISDSAVAYLTTMAICIYYMHRLLKDTGSFYLHCDPTMSHYLKLICDMIFGEKNFKNEIIWRRTGTHNKIKRYAPIHDVILFYAKSDKYKWNELKTAYTKRHVEENFIKEGNDYRTNYYGNVLTSSGLRGGESGKPWRGFNPSAKGRHWAIPGKLIEDFEDEISELSQHQKLDYLFEKGYIKIEKNSAWPIYERRITQKDGLSISDLWAFQPYTQGLLFGTEDGIDEDVRWLGTKDKERLGYPTQKPEGLLTRIIKCSTDEGDVVADFFCGCGTTIATAQMLDRKWLGADISHLAIRLIINERLIPTYGFGIKHNIKIHGLPKDVASAKMLAQETEGGRIGFQDWVIEVMLNGVVNEKKVADGGYDGYLTFNMGKEKHFAIIETKSGKLTVKNMREFVKVVENQKAAVGIFVCFEENVTKEMKKEAKDAGHIKLGTAEFPMDKIQILTIEDLFAGKQPQLPGAAENETFKKSKRKEGKTSSQGLFD